MRTERAELLRLTEEQGKLAKEKKDLVFELEKAQTVCIVLDITAIFIHDQAFIGHEFDQGRSSATERGKQ